jgi:hypothetical protein
LRFFYFIFIHHLNYQQMRYHANGGANGDVMKMKKSHVGLCRRWNLRQELFGEMFSRLGVATVEDVKDLGGMFLDMHELVTECLRVHSAHACSVD